MAWQMEVLVIMLEDLISISRTYVVKEKNVHGMFALLQTIQLLNRHTL